MLAFLAYTTFELFETKIRYDISHVFLQKIRDEYDVDTSSWYEEDNDVFRIMCKLKNNTHLKDE